MGNHGVGKTAIVEGLAYRIQKGDVPNSLKNYEIFQTSATTLNSNCNLNGMLERRILELFEALKNEKNVILFVDEIHTLIGTGRNIEGTSLDISNMIKPFITSDNVKIIGATTSSEYHEYIVPDKAFARRFNSIMIEEPKDKQLEEILFNTITNYSNIYKIKVDNNLAIKISKALVTSTRKEKRNYNNTMYNPDLSIEIIASAFGYARLYDKKEISLEEFVRAFETSNKVTGSLILPKTQNVIKSQIKGNIIKVNFFDN